MELKNELKSNSTIINKLENKYDNGFWKSYRVPWASAAADEDHIQQDIPVTSCCAKLPSFVLDLSESLFQIYLQNIQFDWEEKELVNKKFQLQWTFYNHETSFSPWFSGEQSNLELCTLYKLDIRSDVLEYLFSGECIIQLYVVSPEQTGIIATGKLQFSGALDSPYEKWKLSVPLQLLPNMDETIGVLYCWYQFVCMHKPIKSFIESYCKQKREDYSSKITMETCSESIHKKNDASFTKNISEDVPRKVSSSEHINYDESSRAPEGEEVGRILPEISRSKEEQSSQQHQSTPSEEFKHIMSEQAEKPSLPQQEENLVKSLEHSSPVVKTGTVHSGSDVKLVTSSFGRALSDKLVALLPTNPTPISKASGPTGSYVTFKTLRSERPSGFASPFSRKAIQSSLRKLVVSNDTEEKKPSTLPKQKNSHLSDSSKSSLDVHKKKFREKASLVSSHEKENISSNTTEVNSNSVCSVEVEDKEAEGSVRSIPITWGKQFSSAVITPLRSEAKSPTKEAEDTSNYSAATGMPDPTTDGRSEGDISSVFEESNWRNYSLRSLQIQKEIGNEANSPVSERRDYSAISASAESSSSSTAEELQKSDENAFPYEHKKVKGDRGQISSSSASDVEGDIETQEVVSKTDLLHKNPPSSTDDDEIFEKQHEVTPVSSVKDMEPQSESCLLPVKWEESLNRSIQQMQISSKSLGLGSGMKQNTSKCVSIQSDDIKEVPLPSDADDERSDVQARKRTSEDFSLSEPGTSSKVRKRIPHIYQDPEISRYQDLNDLIVRKPEEKERRFCCFKFSGNQSAIPDCIEIVIHSLTLAHNTCFMRNSDISQLYVEYSFLGYDGEEMETMSALLNHDLHMNFNYRRTFYVDYGMHFKQRTILSNILTSEDKCRRNLRFTVVSEPPEEQDHVKECEEIGYADVDLVQLMTDGRDLIKENIPVRSVDGTERLGFLTISITGVKLMHKVAFETK